MSVTGFPAIITCVTASTDSTGYRSNCRQRPPSPVLASAARSSCLSVQLHLDSMFGAGLLDQLGEERVVRIIVMPRCSWDRRKGC